MVSPRNACLRKIKGRVTSGARPAWTRLEQRDGGVYIEMEMISLSRGIPVGVGWLIKPFIEHMPRTVMLEILKDTRNAVTEQSD